MEQLVDVGVEELVDGLDPVVANGFVWGLKVKGATHTLCVVDPKHKQLVDVLVGPLGDASRQAHVSLGIL